MKSGNKNIGGDCGLVTKLWLTFEISWAVAHQAPLSVRFSRQEYWSGLPFPSRGSSRPWDQTHPFLHCRQILYHWDTREALTKTLELFRWNPLILIAREPSKNRKRLIGVCVCVCVCLTFEDTRDVPFLPAMKFIKNYSQTKNCSQSDYTFSNITYWFYSKCIGYKSWDENTIHFTWLC